MEWNKTGRRILMMPPATEDCKNEDFNGWCWNSGDEDKASVEEDNEKEEAIFSFSVSRIYFDKCWGSYIFFPLTMGTHDDGINV